MTQPSSWILIQILVMFTMQQQDALHRNGNMAILLILEELCTGYQLNNVLVHTYWYKAEHNLSPAYVSELITPYKPTRRLRSSCDEYSLIERRTKSKLYGDQAFQTAAPTVKWITYVLSPMWITYTVQTSSQNISFLNRHTCNILMSKQNFM